MKKIMLLAGVAAAAYGAMKMFRQPKEDEFAIDQTYPASSYTPQPGA